MMAFKLIVTFLLVERVVSWMLTAAAVARMRARRREAMASVRAGITAAEAQLLRDLGAKAVLRSPSGVIYSESCSCGSCSMARDEGPGERL